MRRGHLHLFLALALALIPGCRDEVIVEFQPIPIDTSMTLVQTSFELGGNPSLSGWRTSNPDSVSFATDVPAEGGMWSVTLAGGWLDPGSLVTLVPAPVGTHIVQLDLWAKRNGPGGSAAIMTYQNSLLLPSKTTQVENETWEQLVITDTLTFEEGDSVGVRLFGGISQLLPSATFFDLCLLKKVD